MSINIKIFRILVWGAPGSVSENTLFEFNEDISGKGIIGQPLRQASATNGASSLSTALL